MKTANDNNLAIAPRRDIWNVKVCLFLIVALILCLLLPRESLAVTGSPCGIFVDLFVADPGVAGTVGGGTINCPGVCNGYLSIWCPSTSPPAMVTLLAKPNKGFTFTGWTDCDKPSGNQCTMTVNAVKTVTANFSSIPVAVVPTMTEWGIVIFVMLAGIGSIFHLRPRRES